MARLKFDTDLKKTYADLEKMVEKRTADLAQTVRALEQEIAERRRTEQALRQTEQTLRFLSLKMVETQENERKQLAKELHDSIGSSLAAIKFAVEEKLENMRDDPPTETISLEKIVGHIHDTIKEVRRISTNLRPSMLDDLGLLATIQWHCRRSEEMYSNVRIEGRFEVKEDDLPEWSKIVIYRVTQEALNNALKHSGADTVRIILEKKEECIRACVKDNGCGFDPETKMKGSDPMAGYGLRAMQDRAEVVGGSFYIESHAGQGTIVCLELPCKTNHRT